MDNPPHSCYSDEVLDENHRVMIFSKGYFSGVNEWNVFVHGGLLVLRKNG